MGLLGTKDPRPDGALHFAVDAAVDFLPGDMVFHDADDVKPAHDLTWDTDEATTRKKFCAKFAGISLDKATTTSTEEALVQTAGIVKLANTSTTFEVGDMVGPEKDAGGNYLDSNKVEKVTDPAEAIGWVVERAAAAVTEVWVYLMPAAVRKGLAPTKQHLNFGGTLSLTATGNLVVNFTFGKRVKLTRMICVVTTLVAADSISPVVAYKNGSNSGDDTVTLVEADAVGAIKEVAISDANNYDVFDADDQLDIVCSVAAEDSESAAGACFVILEFVDLP